MTEGKARKGEGRRGRQKYICMKPKQFGVSLEEIRQIKQIWAKARGKRS